MSQELNDYEVAVKRNVALVFNHEKGKVDFSKYLIDDDIMRHVAELLKHNQSVRKIYLMRGSRPEPMRSQISTAGIHYLTEALKINQCLQEIDLRGNNIGLVDCEQLLNLLKSDKSKLIKFFVSDVKLQEQLDECLKKNLKNGMMTALASKKACTNTPSNEKTETQTAVSKLPKPIIWSIFSYLIPSGKKLQANEVPNYIAEL